MSNKPLQEPLAPANRRCHNTMIDRPAWRFGRQATAKELYLDSSGYRPGSPWTQNVTSAPNRRGTN